MKIRRALIVLLSFAIITLLSVHPSHPKRTKNKRHHHVANNIGESTIARLPVNSTVISRSAPNITEGFGKVKNAVKQEAANRNLEVRDKGLLSEFYRKIVRNESSAKLEQSSAYFVDFGDPKFPMVMMPGNASLIDPESWKSCDPTDTNYNSFRDEQCEKYLGNMNNIKGILPMASSLGFARTIKFRYYFVHGDPPLEAVVKIAQKKFAFEPYSEYLGFTVDRILQMNRVPFTGWLRIPVDWIRMSIAQMDPLYVQWVNEFVFNFPELKSTIKKDRSGIETIPTSVQLWTYGMKNVHETDLNPPVDWHQIFSMAQEVPKNKAWALAELCDLFVFDYILGNTDRGMGKNNYAVTE